MPPVALTVASAPAFLSSRRAAAITPYPSAAEVVPAPAGPEVLPERPATRPRLRLVTSAEVTTEAGHADQFAAADVVEIVHGHGGPASCRCRACTMARHPAAMLPRLTVVR